MTHTTVSKLSGNYIHVIVDHRTVYVLGLFNQKNALTELHTTVRGQRLGAVLYEVLDNKEKGIEHSVKWHGHDRENALLLFGP